MEHEKAPRESIDGDEEAQTFLKHEDDEPPPFVSQDRFPPPPPANLERKTLSKRFWLSAAINTLSTAAIVFINKQVFLNPHLRHTQVTFAAFHFLVTFALLSLLSHPHCGLRLFPAKQLSPATLLPLAAAMIANVVLPNASLACSSIQFYQVARVLLTPCVAGLNWGLYGRRLPPLAVAALAVVCCGVAVVSWFDTAVPAAAGKTAAAAATTTTTTQPLGVFFALAGVLASSLYTVWIQFYHEKLECSSMQLLLNQAPISVVMMLYVIPFSDDVTVWGSGSVGGREFGLIGLSGLLACMINLSQFVIINEAGPVSSTVVGHFKTCAIIAMGWCLSGKSLGDGSLVGIALAVGGIISYSYVMQKQTPS